jgi:hypothetical protein
VVGWRYKPGVAEQRKAETAAHGGKGKAGSEMCGVLFWVNLARKDKGVEPSAQILNPQDVPVRQDGDARVHHPPSLADDKTEEHRSSPASD